MNLSGFHPRSRYSRFGLDNGMPVIVAFLVRCLRHLFWKLDLLISGGFGRRPDSYQDKLDSRASYFVLCSRALVYKRRADVLYLVLFFTQQFDFDLVPVPTLKFPLGEFPA